MTLMQLLQPVEWQPKCRQPKRRDVVDGRAMVRRRAVANTAVAPLGNIKRGVLKSFKQTINCLRVFRLFLIRCEL